MRKSTRIVKRTLALFLVVLMSINTMGAVVSDNDGSAFVTKAEFDVLKNGFADQIANYNNSIDNKIDGAIAAYLAGIKLSKKIDIEPLIGNYRDMMWQPNYKVYGKWLKWTNNTTRTASSGNVWFEPSLNEKRMQLREPSLFIYDKLEAAMVVWDFGMLWSLIGSYNGVSLGYGAWSASGGYDQACPTCCLEVMQDTDGLWYIPSDYFPLTNMYVVTPEMNVKVHTVDSGTALHNFNGQPMTLLTFTPQSGSGDTLFKYSFETRNYTATSGSYAYTSSIKKSYCDYPVIWRKADVTYPANFGNIPQAVNTTSSSFIQNNYFTGGCTWHYLPQIYRSNFTNQLKYMMLGSNYDLDVNLAYNTGKQKSEGYIFDFSKSTQYGYFQMQRTGQLLSNLQNKASGTAGYWTKGEGVYPTVQVPHWPSGKLREQTTKVFMNGQDSLKIGQGMPLLLSSDEKGILQVEFDYDIRNLLNSSIYTTAQTLYVDLKKDDFMDKSTTSADFYDAYSDLVDGTTSAPIYKYQNYAYPTKTGNAKISIPLEKGADIWFRMRPSDETGGYYATMKNLKLTLIPD